MPTATPFNAGRGNGFTSCPDKVDVSGYDYWTTLGGWSKVSEPNAKAQSIADSLENAMKLSWNLNGGIANYSANSPGGSANIGLSIDGDAGDYTGSVWEKIAGGNDLDVFFQPMDRVCYSGFIVTEFDIVSGTDVSLSISSSIERMYDGPTSDEDNFVGYGNGGVGLGTEGGLTSGGLSLKSYANVDDINFSAKAEYLNINDIPVVAIWSESNEDPGAGITIDQDGSGIIASVSFPFSPGTNETYELTSLDFYTY